MQRALFAALFLVLASQSASAAPAPLPLETPVPASKPAEALPSAPKAVCVEVHNPADYVPGVDVYGRAVAPADLPGSTADLQIGAEVYAELRARNPQLRGLNVGVMRPGCSTPPPAAPAGKP